MGQNHERDEVMKLTVLAHRPIKRSTLSHIIKQARLSVISARDMSKKERKRYEKKKNKHFSTYEEAAEWFNSHDMADFEDQLKPVDF